MALRDSSTGRLVVRIAYDGAPLAGKTETLRSLGRLLEQPVESMEEAYGRTLWFDWMRYDGGMYEGSPIACEVVALPGQTALERRRRILLEDADAVVFVADCSPPGHDGTRTAMARYRTWLLRRPAPPALVVQANKRDVAGAWRPPQLRTALDLSEDVPVVESVATTSTGVRRAFVAAVGRAVRRAECTRRERGDLRARHGPHTAAEVRARVAEPPPPPPAIARQRTADDARVALTPAPVRAATPPTKTREATS